eukprot:6953771-Pyramimonas_sp.AAC.1
MGNNGANRTIDKNSNNTHVTNSNIIPVRPYLGVGASREAISTSTPTATLTSLPAFTSTSTSTARLTMLCYA